MKWASNHIGTCIEAKASAPQQAQCPHCGGRVILRQRRRSRRAGDVTYFWRHQNHIHRNCPARYHGGRINPLNQDQYVRQQ